MDDNLSTFGSQQINDAKVEALVEAFTAVDSEFDAAEYYKVDHFLYGLGLGVKPSYRGRGIATELLKARAPLMSHLGLSMTSTIFTGIETQKAAQSAGYFENYTISYAELQQRFPNLDFSTANATHCRTQSLTI